MITAEDKLLILDILAQANLVSDKKDAEGLASFYTSDGVIEGDMQANGTGDAFVSDIKNIFENEPGLKRHVGTNHIFSGSAERVLVESLLTVLEGDDAPALVATAKIRDELVREDATWKIARHVVTMDPGTKKAMSDG